MKNSVATRTLYTHCKLAHAKDPVPPVISKVLSLKSDMISTSNFFITVS